jgi:hypothetical protein
MKLIAALILSVLTSTPRTWNDSTRDVYIDGKLRRDAQTLVTDAPRRIAVLCGEEVFLFDPASKSVSTASAAQFALASDRTSATSKSDIDGAAAGTFVKPDASSYLAEVGGKSVLVTTHQSQAGPITMEELWATVPVWRAIADAYEPDAKIVDDLRQIDEPTRVQVVLATWCGDSKQHVPRLLKAIERANNANVIVELHGIGPDFESPMAFIQGESITNVPTFIVRRGERELGRVVETPAVATIEEDVADIAYARQRPHPGRWERGAKLAEGTYVLRDARRRDEGREQFTIYERPAGGVLAHSVIARADGAKTETWIAVDDRQTPKWAEVTHHANGTSTRTRYRYDNGHFTATSRGARGGITTQTLEAKDLALVTPATISYGWSRGTTYVAPEQGVGALCDANARVTMDATRNVPRVVRFSDGSERRLR